MDHVTRKYLIKFQNLSISLSKLQFDALYNLCQFLDVKSDEMMLYL